MSAPFDPSASRRYVLPPLWAVPPLLIAAITAVVVVALWFGWAAIVPALVVIAWLERKADRHVRARQQALCSR